VIVVEVGRLRTLGGFCTTGKGSGFGGEARGRDWRDWGGCSSSLSLPYSSTRPITVAVVVAGSNSCVALSLVIYPVWVLNLNSRTYSSNNSNTQSPTSIPSTSIKMSLFTTPSYAHSSHTVNGIRKHAFNPFVSRFRHLPRSC